MKKKPKEKIGVGQWIVFTLVVLVVFALFIAEIIRIGKSGVAPETVVNFLRYLPK